MHGSARGMLRLGSRFPSDDSIRDKCLEYGFATSINNANKTHSYWSCAQTTETTQTDGKKKKVKCPYTFKVKFDGKILQISGSNYVPHTHPIFPPRPVSGPRDILWLGIPDCDNIGNARFLGIDHDHKAHCVIPDYPMLNTDLNRLKATLNKSFIVHTASRAHSIIHQSVIAMEYTSQKLGNHIEYRSWKWVHDTIPNSTFIPESLANKPLLVFLSSTVDDAQNGMLSIEQFYDAMQLVAMQHGNLRIYPNAMEMRQARFKVGDIRALDLIAQESEEEFAYRPKTCSGGCPCVLRVDDNHQQNIIKESHSCGAQGVRVCNTAEAQIELGCGNKEKGDPQTRKRKRSQPAVTTADRLTYPIRLHQEYIDTLRSFGEFRVFLTAPVGLLIQEPEIIAVAFTRFSDWGGDIVARQAKPDDFRWAGKGNKKEQELRVFAKYIYRKICERHDANEAYESFKIGARLDIGISDLSNSGRFFVNEITR
ncbi:hypothetical protein F4821DRAFT_247138 [Hypoxylon rubiginosum]|uniref:Uncharacterized protein n=1 Tax=Hypoxylon rubiginosum TaxID=110542 RepID=A0ACC0CPR0_9PEZI|nr:hypothetical protein F4821DRAFT_247138 [Hypoxylon rubiginosum]